MGIAGFVEGGEAQLSALGRHANRVEPAAYEDLGMRLTAEVPGRWAIGSFDIPFQNRQPHIAALNDEPVDWIRGHDPADFALEFSQRGHIESVSSMTIFG